MTDTIDELFNTAPCGFLSFIDDGTMVMANYTFLDLLGYEINEIVGKKIDLVLPIASRIFYQTHFFPLLKLHYKAEEIYFSLKSKEGKSIPMLVNAVRQMKNEQTINNCIFIPIHQRIQYEDEILKAKKAAETAILAQQKTENELRELYAQLQIELKERHQAEEIIRQQAAREILLRKITQRIHQSSDIETIFTITVEEIRQYFQADRVAIYQFTSNSNYREGEFICESIGMGFNSTLGVKITDCCFSQKYVPYYRSGKIQVVEDINLVGFKECHIEILKRFQIHANLVAPLLKGDELWGLLCVHQCSSSRSWQDFEIYFVQQIADQLAIAIQQSDLLQQLQTELAERKIIETQLTETNEKLAISNHELIHATQAKSQFLANMSHEIRTPMNGVIGMAQLLSMTTLSEEQKDFVDTIKDSGHALLTIINDILDFSKIESGKLELEEHPVQLKDMLKSICNLFIKQTADKQINLTYQINDSVPPNILGDSSRLRQIILNLVGNAIKFTNSGSVFILVDILKKQEQIVELIICIQDTGIGIDQERMRKLFQPFTQADASISRKYGGTGLGLAISKSLINLMGGTIWIVSLGNIGGNPPENWNLEPEKLLTGGTNFYFTITVKIASTPTLIQTTNIPENLYQNPENISQSSLKILLAEDNKVNQKVVNAMLKKIGYTADIANNGLEVLTMLEKRDYHIVLMDMQMPEMDGITATKMIRQGNKHQPYIIALTANALEEDRQMCLNVGMNDFITKPIVIHQLIDALKNVTSN